MFLEVWKMYICSGETVLKRSLPPSVCHLCLLELGDSKFKSNGTVRNQNLYEQCSGRAWLPTTNSKETHAESYGKNSKKFAQQEAGEVGV